MKTVKNSATSIRVLETLKILAQGNASIQDIIRYFEKTDPNNRIYTNEVILKYLNTLKVFGFRIKKEKDKYVLLNSPYPFDFEENDLRAINLIEKINEILPEEKLKDEVCKFIQDLEKRFSDNTRILAHKLEKPNGVSFKFNYDKYNGKIKEYEKYCLDNQKLKIIYKKPNYPEISVILEPLELKYIGSEVYFSLYNPTSAQIIDLEFNSIIDLKQLPLKSNPTNLLSSVTFKLMDGLASNYKLHDEERLIQKNPDGSIIILSQKEDRERLLRRLMRYGDLCEIISPQAVRKDMQNLIKSTLKNYL